MIFRIIIIFWLLLNACDMIAAQSRKPLQRRKDQPNGAQFIGVSGGFNQISGLSWEFQLNDRNRQLSRSTVTLTAGYTLRFPEYRTIDWVDTVLRHEREWTGGFGMSGFLNNYQQRNLQGVYWSVGLGGHVFIRGKKKFKIMSVSALAGYKKPIAESIYFQINAGLSVMGSIFKSSTGAEVNGFFPFIGAGMQYRLR